MIDRELVTRKMVLITEDLERLERLAARSREEYLASEIDEIVAERCLERMIGRMIDVNYHVLTESGEPPPRDYFDSFVALARVGALPSDFAARIAACAGLRNRIVHAYDDLDPGRVHDALGAASRDVPEYLARIRAVIGPQDPGRP
jgi:uncharacterized protein YutE (UPF0331/DUF86 family)